MASNYADFKAEWSGHRVDYDGVYGWQCVDIILEYLKECYGLVGGISGNAIDYWYRTSPPILTKFDRVQTTDCHQGDIVVLNGLSGNPYGHIGVCDHEDTGNVYLLEQNGTGSGTGTGESAVGVWRAIPKSRIAGVLRPHGAPGAAAGPPHGTATVHSSAYVRSAPNLGAALAGSRILNPGDTFVYINKVPGTSVAGNNIWYESQFQHYVWSGNLSG